MGEAARQECSEGHGRALDEEERRELLRLQEPCRRGQGAQVDPQMGCDGRGRARQSEAGRCARSGQHRQGGLGGQRLPLGRDRGGPEGEALAEPYPPACRTQSSAVRAPEVGEHDALEGARPCRARIRPPAELDGRQDRAYHRHRAGEVQDRDDEPRLQHPPVGSARAGGGCARLSALTGGVRVVSCKRTARSPAGIKTVPNRGLPLARALQPLAQPRQKSRKAGIVRGALVKNLFNRKFATFGTYFDPQVIANAIFNLPTDQRMVTPAPPLSVYIGLRGSCNELSCRYKWCKIDTRRERYPCLGIGPCEWLHHQYAE